MSASEPPANVTRELPAHLESWQLPPGWSWGSVGMQWEYRHSQEVVDALGRSLALVSAPDAAHAEWLEAEARHLAHRSSHPSIPTTYHYWTGARESHRGPGYLRRWVVGETISARLRRVGALDVPSVLQLLRSSGSALAYLHDTGAVHGALSTDNVWATPTGRLWLLGWQWSVPRDVPPGLAPDPTAMPVPPEWHDGWSPTPVSDQWLLGALCFAALTGEGPPPVDIPPIQWLRPECPQAIAAVIDRSLLPDVTKRHPSVGGMLRAAERAGGSRIAIITADGANDARPQHETEEAKLRWAVGDDYEVLAALGSGTFGSVWRVRDLALEREVALKMLHPHIGIDDVAVGRFRREARLAAQLAHPAIVPIYDWDSRGDVSWYTMELADGGSVANLMAQSGPRALAEVAPQIDQILDGLVAAHASGIIHRDLKPENILVDRYQRWRLTDFGIANMYGEEMGGASGTPAFAAPEQLLGEAQGPGADCFAIAAIVAYLLTGVAPFGDADSKRILARELAGEVDLTPFPPPIADWLRLGLAPDPDNRFADASDMQEGWRMAVRVLRRGQRRNAWWRRLVEPTPGVIEPELPRI